MMPGPDRGGLARHLWEDIFTPALQPAPIGYYLHSAMQVQTDLAKAERLVIYREEWQRGTPVVKDCALYHLEQIAEWLRSNCKPYSVYPVRVEPSGDPVVDQTRRLTIVHFLVERGVADAETRVLFGTGRAEGLQGEWIERVYQRGQTIGSSGGAPLFGTGGGLPGVFPPSFGFGGFGGFNGFFGGGGFRGF